jgi:hypothetical protein
MSRSIRGRLLLFGVLVLLAWVRPAAAQFPYSNRPVGNPYQQPTISPYLNLLRAGDPAANYFLLVRPEFQQRALNAQFGSAIVNLERGTAAPAAPAGEPLLPTLEGTGHATYFLNYGGYFGTGPGQQRATQPQAPLNRSRR